MIPTGSADHAGSSTGGGIFRALGACALFAALAVVHTYPLVWHTATDTPGLGLGDNVSFIWNVWWMRVALGSPADYFHSSALMAPLGAPLVLNTHTALAAFGGATLFGWLDVATAQNLIVLASVALNGFCAWGLARHVTGDPRGAIVAGVLFMLAPVLTARLMGHFNLLLAWTLVLGCLAALRLGERRGLLDALLLGGAVAATLYADYYLFVFLLVFVVLWCGAELWSVRASVERRPITAFARACFALAATCLLAALAIGITGGGELAAGGVRVSARRPQNLVTAAWLLAAVGAFVRWRPAVSVKMRTLPADVRRMVTLLLAAASVSAVLAAPLIAAAAQLIASGDYVTEASSLKSGPQGIDVGTVVLGPPHHGVLGESIRSLYAHRGIEAMEQSAWVGITPVALALLGAVAARQARQRRWTLIATVFFVWALGPSLIAFGAQSGVLLPQALLRAVPIVNNARIPGRAMIVVSLALAMLSAVQIAASPRLRRWPATVLLVLVAFVELGAAPLPLSRLPAAGAIERHLARDPHPGHLLPVPFGLRDGFGERGAFDHRLLYLQTRHGRAMAGGFVARVPPRIREWYARRAPFAALLSLSAGQAPSSLPSCAEALSGLREAGIGYVLVDDRSAGRAADLVKMLPLERVLAEDGRRLLLLPAAAACPP